ncbi:PREDICTED: extended synaptotagmin-2-B [Rhagoletis zephyria]|uniref:extended synaptotagmin-2-B n=1 Tax=Rhagoletis zephyria TaxID=28612 RepID=UPI00081194FA|nr:PREDICTED: extended synaptotagmin-2-B [Rhagoletis zephyria]XP_017465616.1 PREDICTED: extended synaptotagmin-2-B [Rhagoletis zephyria]XP_017465617.1 PREDICTED: extended synaptotagmin-2-B [Rhagoletis zephyria]XP_017465619.1 PREDICTED: extended synaptotagmin-2-B [Rhagoletis zephyria]XP_017465620.1 PREDICTED: extended synaptotagmin-2-B [Rhagoletis zephyria]XP_017465621.1 PREDICTED: extended synaptotagmin-2-B [Rhagoletis zephyria]
MSTVEEIPEAQEASATTTAQQQPVTSAATAEPDPNVPIPSVPLAEFTTPPATPPPDESEMAAASKEVNPENAVVSTSSSSDGIFSLIYTVFKKVAVVGSIYLVGYMGWSVAWLIAPVILSVTRDQFRKTTEYKRNIAKASAMASEKDVILARIDELPAWVYFPDVERCEWVNKILKQVWPNANHYARKLVKETIEPNVALALANYKMNGFRFDRMILGTIPPRIGGVKIYDKNVDRNEIIMDLDLFYASDCDINFYLGSMKGGIKDFQIHGWVRVVMKPLIRSMPLVGGLQIFFLNNPNIDFNLVGVIDFMDMPGLSDLLRRIIVEQIGAVMVLPNKLPITLSNEVPAISLKMPEPEGILRIHVVEAKDLMKKDIGVLGKGKSDPYAVINVGAQEFKTQIIENNVNPKWDYWCEAKIFVELGQSVDITVLDMDNSSDDEKLGRATIEIFNVIKRGVVDTWLTLEDAKHGLLHVRMQWYKLTADPNDLQAALLETQLLRVTSMSTALLTVFIDSAKNLKQARTSSKPDPYLIAMVGKHKEQTAMIMRDDSPVWEQGFTFLVGNPENESLQIRVVDQKTGNDIGQYTYPVNLLLPKKNMELMSQPFQLQKSGPESKLIMSLSLRILKPGEVVEESEQKSGSTESSAALTRSSSVKTPTLENASSKDLQSPTSRISAESPIVEEQVETMKPSPTATPYSAALESGEAVLTHRMPDLSSSTGEYGLGRMLLSIRYSVQRQKLTVTVHKIMYLPLRDPSNIPDPYVKLYLLPGRSKESKRKTMVIKDSCNPVYESTFEYLISTAELAQTALEVTVCSQKGFIYGGSPIMGMLRIALNDPEISTNGLNSWMDLQPEIKHD